MTKEDNIPSTVHITRSKALLYLYNNLALCKRKILPNVWNIVLQHKYKQIDPIIKVCFRFFIFLTGVKHLNNDFEPCLGRKKEHKRVARLPFETVYDRGHHTYCRRDRGQLVRGQIRFHGKLAADK
jgi:hypothetical protein